MTSSWKGSTEGGWLFLGADMDETARLDVGSGQVAVLTRVGAYNESENEDAAVVVDYPPTGALLAIADGCGGEPAGERAARIAVSELASGLASARAGEKLLRASILDGFESANREIQELGIGAATTLAAVGIENGIVRPFHAGDSTILLVGGRGKIKWQSMEHSLAGYAVASGLVDESEARGHEEAQVVANYLGYDGMRIEVGPELELAPRDTVLLASDGLTDNLMPEEIAEILVRKKLLVDAVQALAHRAQRRMKTAIGKPDDLTIVAYRQRRL